MEEPIYPYVHVDIRPELTDEVGSLLFELGASGVEERDATTLVKGAALGVTLVASFSTRDEADAAVAALNAEWSPRVEVIVGDAWRDEWKKYFHTFSICPGVVITPPWEPYAPKPGESVIELEPGRAFGTGLHETTSLVAEALHHHRREITGTTVLDLGCGSGILAFIAMRLGATRACGFDFDPEAIDVAVENATRNGVTASAAFAVGDVVAIEGKFPIVVANIEASVLIPHANSVANAVIPGGLLILSGILVTQSDEVRAAYPTFESVDCFTKGEWQALVLRAPPAPG